MHTKPLANSFQRTDVTSAQAASALIPSGLLVGGAIPPSVAYLYLVADGQALRWTDDGTTPTTATGFYLPVGQSLIIDRGQFASFKVISTAAGGYADTSAYTQ